MNFVDVQPKAFLDYAWTSPTPMVMNDPKPSRTSRKQNRCCDQCRKGKRACNAAILEDSLLDTSKSGDHPSVFHYSDVYGPLAACGNCEKTKKSCTFEWLRSQRMSQATLPPSNTSPPAKRRRTNGDTAIPLQQPNKSSKQDQAGGPLCISDAACSKSSMSPAQLGVTFGNFPGMPGSEVDQLTNVWYNSISASEKDELGRFSDIFEDDTSPLTYDSGQSSSLETPPGSIGETTAYKKQCHNTGDNSVHDELMTKSDGAVMRIGRKRRRRTSSVSLSNGALPCPAISFAAEFVSSADKAFLREGLLKIYHDSFENALSCWLTERTCPYSAKADISLTNNEGPDWNRMYHRVFRLDRLASSIRGRQFNFQEDKAIGKALNSAIFSFATQWAHSSERSSAKYPFDHSGTNTSPGVFRGQDMDGSLSGIEFDRSLQITAWHEAHLALQNVGEIESFRLVLAQIVFSLTQRPNDLDTNGKPERTSGGFQLRRAVPGSRDEEVDECENLMSRLSLVMDAEDPPVHLEKAIRLIHSLRSRMAMCASTPLVKPRSNRRGKMHKPSMNRIDAADRATIDLLFWLGVMFDTLSSAIRKRPLVLSDEDSNVYASETSSATHQIHCDAGPAVSRSAEGVWDAHLFANQRIRLQQNPVRWPCSFSEAGALLCDAAPVKVLLFRKVTRIQTLITRGCRGERIERSIKAALSVCEHWNQLYALFIQDCVQYHNTLPPRIQSWYICLAGHWYLATLLLADLIEIVDDSEFGLESQQTYRSSTNLVAQFRRVNCRALSDLARCACPRENAPFSQSQDFHSVMNEGALLTEPWTEVLVRAFAKAGVVLLENEGMLPPSEINSASGAEDTLQCAGECIKALWYLGRKSDIALSAAKILGEALEQRVKDAEDQSKALNLWLQAEMWQNFRQLNGSMGWD